MSPMTRQSPLSLLFRDKFNDRNPELTSSAGLRVNQDIVRKIVDNIESALLGKSDTVQLAVVTLLAGGHILLEDAPGLGKTSLARALAKTLGCGFTRLQFTPDMLPSDILGGNIYRPATGEFEFRAGPVFNNVLLADEINRTTPRTQSALLEAMSERQVSIDGTTHQLPHPFLVIATQNPFEFEGTYPLPENQLDRFMMCLSIGYPDRKSEMEILQRHRNGQPVDALNSVVTPDSFVELQQHVQTISVDSSLSEYMLEIIDRTRSNNELTLGVSTRGALTLYRAAQSLAMVSGREYVIPDDIKRLVIPVLSHRIVCRGTLQEGHRARASQILRMITDSVAVPS